MSWPCEAGTSVTLCRGATLRRNNSAPFSSSPAEVLQWEKRGNVIRLLVEIDAKGVMDQAATPGHGKHRRDDGIARLSGVVAMLVAMAVLVAAGLTYDAGGETFAPVDPDRSAYTIPTAGLIDARCVETLPGAWDDGKLDIDTETQECTP